jgi:hypothetical protein
MVVKIRFGQGSVVTRRKGKNRRLALLGAALLTMVSICLASLGMWRFCQDFGLAGDFVFQEGLLSHWQVWIAAAAVIQYACWRLGRYALVVRQGDRSKDGEGADGGEGADEGEDGFGGPEASQSVAANI